MFHTLLIINDIHQGSFQSILGCCLVLCSPVLQTTAVRNHSGFVPHIDCPAQLGFNQRVLISEFHNSNQNSNKQLLSVLLFESNIPGAVIFCTPIPWLEP